MRSAAAAKPRIIGVSRARAGTMAPARAERLALLLAEQEPVVLVDGMDPSTVLRIHPLGEERRRLLIPVRGEVRLVVVDVLVELAPLVGGVLRPLAPELVERLVDPWVADEALVERDLRLERVRGEQRLEEVARVRVVLIPVREADLGLRPLQADLLEVHLLVERLRLGVEAHLVQEVAEVIGDGRSRVLVVGPDSDLLALVPGLLDELLRLRHVPLGRRVAPLAVEVLVTRELRR